MSRKCSLPHLSNSQLPLNLFTILLRETEDDIQVTLLMSKTPQKYLIPQHREGSKAENLASLVQEDSLTHSERGRGRKQNDIKTLSHITLKTVPWLQPCLTLIIMRCSWYILLGPQKFGRFFTEFQNSDQISFASMCHSGCLIQLHVAIFCFLSVGIWPPQSHLRPQICNTLATLH